MKQRLAPSVWVCALLLCSHEALAFEWQSLWLRPDQRVQELIEKEAYEQAKALAETPEQKALVSYRAGEYEQAAEQYLQSENKYNVGTSLVRAGDYAAAIEAFEQALAENPENENALVNKEIAEKLAALNQQQQSGDGENQDQQDQSQQGEQPPDSDQPSDGESDADDSSQQSDQSQDSDGDGEQEPEDDQEPQEQPSPDGQPNEQDPEESEEPQERETPQTQARDEKQQTMDQWLQQVPDDPAGLLRARIIREHQRNYSNSQDKEQAW